MPSYYEELKALAESIGSDGCTSATQWRQECCWEHDWAYITGMTPRGMFISKEQADRRFRDCLQAHSSFRWLSPMSWWRYLAVRAFGMRKVDRIVTVAPVRSVFRNWDAIAFQARQAKAARIRILKDMGLLDEDDQ